MKHKVVLDTNVFVAAGFNRRSSSARILSLVSEGKLQLVWNERTVRETRKIVSKIPPIRWGDFEELFEAENEYKEPVNESGYGFVEDRDDRKFAALAEAAECVLVTNDDHLLSVRDKLECAVMTPGEFVRNLKESV